MKSFKDILKEAAVDLNVKSNNVEHHELVDHFLETEEGKELHAEIKEILKKDLD